jgi:hypothetical protein
VRVSLVGTRRFFDLDRRINGNKIGRRKELHEVNLQTPRESRIDRWCVITTSQHEQRLLVLGLKQIEELVWLAWQSAVV